jgi:hypothetical protein
LLGAALAALALLAGCGGDDGAGGGGGDDGASAQVSKAELIERADAICARSRRRFQRGLASYVPPEVKRTEGTVPSADTFAGAFEKFGLAAIQQQAEELRELAARGDDAELDAYVEALEAALRDVEGQDEVTGPEFLEAFAASTRQARAYGLDGCSLG